VLGLLKRLDGAKQEIECHFGEDDLAGVLLRCRNQTPGGAPCGDRVGSPEVHLSNSPNGETVHREDSRRGSLESPEGMPVWGSAFP